MHDVILDPWLCESMEAGDEARVACWLASEGDPQKYSFNKPRLKGYDYSFSGLKTSFLYFLRDQLKENAGFIEQNKADLAASLQKTIITILMNKLGPNHPNTKTCKTNWEAMKEKQSAAKGL